MPRQPRLDAPGALHHVIGRGINGVKIFNNRKDRDDFIERLAGLCGADALSVYAWAFLSNIGKKDGLFWCGCCALSRYKHFCC